MHQAHQYVNGGISMSLVRESPHAVPWPRRPPRRRHLLPSARFASCLQDIHTRQTQQHEALRLEHCCSVRCAPLCVPVPPALRVCNICCAKVIIATDKSPGVRQHAPAAAAQAQVYRSTVA